MASDAEQLIRQARGGDAEALGRLLEPYRTYLTILARVQIGKQLRGKVDPADVVQETFLEVHRRIAHFRGDSPPRFLAWLRSILATRLALVQRQFIGTRARAVGLERDIERELGDTSRLLSSGLAAPDGTPSQYVAAREQEVLLAGALAALPKDYQEVILLRNLEGLPPEEVARRMNRSRDSVQKLWVRGLAALRRALDGERDTE
jgi:RNA polymerase sigma-70 factor (ECF subfamily)